MKSNIPEDFLHYIWKIKNFDLKNLKTTNGQELNILNFGIHNHDAGPDFLNASVEIDNLIWHGHIEMHIKSSDWNNHHHSQDAAYDNVVLHVVLNHDQTILDKGDNPLPTLNLKSRIEPKIYNAYGLLMNKKVAIPCKTWIDQVNQITLSSTIDKVLAERLTLKSHEILQILEQNGGNWTETIYQRLLWSFGLRVNADACIRLGSLLSYKILLKHHDNLTLVESLLFGVAGLIPENSDGYTRDLDNHFTFLKEKYSITSMRAVEWKFMRMRPSGFPTIRLAQFARLICKNAKLENLIFDTNIDELKDLFKVSIDNGYWLEHYNFKSESPKRKKTIGDQKLYSILINSVAPLQYAYGLYTKSDVYKENAINLLDSIPPESNHVLKEWNNIGILASSASQSQALLHLKKHYCDQYKCLSCSIGHQVFKKIQSA